MSEINHRLFSWLESAISGCTFPPHAGVINHTILEGSGPGGFVITLIPESTNAPHQVVNKTQYYMRAGSTFVPVPHQILAGMFGRRPAPNLISNWLLGDAEVTAYGVRFELGASIRNDGPGIARDLFQGIQILSGAGDNTRIEFHASENTNWTGAFAFGFAVNLISKAEFRLPPKAFAQPMVVNFLLSPPFTKRLVIERTDGCEGMAPKLLRIDNSPANIQGIYDELMSARSQPKLRLELLSAFPQKVLGLE